MQRPRKLNFYAPGLISLAILFPLFMHQLNALGYFKKYYVLESIWFNPKAALTEKWMTLPDRKWLQIDLIGNKRMDQSRMKQVRTVAGKLLQDYDTINGVHIRLADTAKYESLVDILNTCQIYDRLGYLGYENDFWLFNQTPITMKDVTWGFCGTSHYVTTIPSQ